MSGTETLSKTLLQPPSMCEPPRFSDWNALSEVEQRSCVSRDCLTSFERTDDWTHAWPPDGPLKRHWEEELLIMCKAVIDSPENRKMLRKKYTDRKNRSYPLYVRLLMLAKAENRDMARPFVMFEHPDALYVVEAKKLFEKQQGLNGYGFEFMARVRPTRMLMYYRASHVPSLDSNQSEELSREDADVPRVSVNPSALFPRARPSLALPDDRSRKVQFSTGLSKMDVSWLLSGTRSSEGTLNRGTLALVTSDGDDKHRDATIGGYLLVDDRLYALTVAHAFCRDVSTSSSSTDEDSDNSSRGATNSSVTSNTSPWMRKATVELSRTAVIARFRNRTRFQVKFGPENQKPTGSNSVYSAESDWALIALADGTISELLEQTLPTTLDACKVCESSSPPSIPVKILGGKSGVRSGRLQSSSSLLMIPSLNRSTIVWAVEPLAQDKGPVETMTGAQGDCGSWVVDETGQNLYGIVDSDDRETGVTYILPAPSIFADIQKTFGLKAEKVSIILPRTQEESGERLSPRMQQGSAERLALGPEIPKYNPNALFGQSRNARHATDIEPARPWSRSRPMTPSVQELAETVPRHNYAGFVNYIVTHQQLIGPDSERDLISEAIKAMRMRQHQHAENCIEKSLLLRECDERISDRRKFTDYLKVLQKDRLPNEEQFAARRKRVIEHCEKRAEELGVANVPPQPLREPGYHDSTRGPKRSQIDAITAGFGAWNVRTGMPPQTEDFLSPGDSVTSQINVRGAHPLRGIEGSAVFQEKLGLKGEFKQRFRNEAKEFFRVGRVFMICLHQELSFYKQAGEASSTQGLITHNKELDMEIISHKTRFVVVRAGSTYCWAVPIRTYGGRGLHKDGLNPEEVRAHAIVYTSQNPCTVSINNKDEPRMTKKALKVLRAQSNDECSLHRASRANFARPTTIEHNVNALNIGLVHRDDRPYLEQYWEEQLQGRDV